MLVRVAAVALSAFVCACGSASGSGATGGYGGTGTGGTSGFGGSFAGTSGSGGITVEGGIGGGGPGCSAESQFVYVIDQSRVLYKFDPPSLVFTAIGPVNCPGFAGPFSMAVDRNAHAWVVFTDGTLFQVNTSNAACTATTFAPGQAAFLTFGMGFSTDGPTSTVDTLFVSGSGNGLGGTSEGLATIDTQSLVLTPVAKYDLLQGRAEMTGTGDGRLFGAFEGTPYVVAEVEKTTAKILTQAPQTQVQYAPGSSNFAFAFWGGDFYLFVGPGTKTDVFHYQPGAGTTTLATTVPQVIVGAGVSTCAPTKPPR